MLKLLIGLLQKDHLGELWGTQKKMSSPAILSEIQGIPLKNLVMDHGFQNLVMVLKCADHFQVKYLRC